MILFQRPDRFLAITEDNKVASTDFATLLDQMMSAIEAQADVIEDLTARIVVLEGP